MKQKKQIIMISLIGICVVILSGIIFFYFFRDSKKDTINLNKTSRNYQSSNDTIRFLYDRYQVEDGNKFSIVGSNTYSEIDDSYGFYYKNDIKFKDFPSIYKNYILLDLINYQTGKYDEDRDCYFYSLDEFKDLYKKYYGSVGDFKIDTNAKYSTKFYLDTDNLCISSNRDVLDYSKTIDTYFVNGVFEENKIIIYERVAFVNITDKTVDFYSDYLMKNKVYSLNKEKADLSFIHQSKIVSNVLLKYQKKFPIYKYQYKKGNSTYYLENISS